MSDHTEPFLVEPGWTDAYLIDNLGPTYRLLTYADGTVRFEHRCDRGDRDVIICAPALRDHTITQTPCPNPPCQWTHDTPTVRQRTFLRWLPRDRLRRRRRNGHRRRRVRLHGLA